MMSDTPRTDAEAISYHAIKCPRYPNGEWDVNVKWVGIDFARQLERELDKSKGDTEAWNRAYHAELKRFKDTADEVIRLSQERDELKAENSELKREMRDNGIA